MLKIGHSGIRKIVTEDEFNTYYKPLGFTIVSYDSESKREVKLIYDGNEIGRVVLKESVSDARPITIFESVDITAQELEQDSDGNYILNIPREASGLSLSIFKEINIRHTGTQKVINASIVKLAYSSFIGITLTQSLLLYTTLIGDTDQKGSVSVKIDLPKTENTRQYQRKVEV